MKNKILLTSGCSFTDPNYLIKYNYDPSLVWPELLSKKLKYKNINIARAGTSNCYIYHQTIKAIAEKKPDLLCVLWTGFDRFSSFNIDHCPVGYNYHLFKKDNYREDDYFKFYQKVLENDDGVSANHSLLYMHSLQEYCKSINLPYIFYQGFIPYEYEKMERLFIEKIIKNNKFSYYGSFYRSILESPYFDLLDEDKFIDFPFCEILGGSCFMERYLNGEGNPLRIYPDDIHPGILGHEKLAEIFYSKYTDLYK